MKKILGLQDLHGATSLGPRSCTAPTHVLCANDIMVFCKGTLRNHHNLMAIFKDYGEALGQSLGMDICQFFVGDMKNSRKIRIQNFLGFHQGLLPFTYLGILIFKGKPKIMHLQGITDRILAKLASQKRGDAIHHGDSLVSIIGDSRYVGLQFSDL